ncbi:MULTISPECIES: M23 family metallopeptidase [Lacrimispora]|nr:MULTISPECIES: M23 family metallopeptidase [Lacrimispora]MDR7814449.1 M23 family metallopeptidase [Lacrimispora sp.]
MHRSRLLVKREVWQGQVIANVGHTGYSTGPYLYFEIRQTASM